MTVFAESNVPNIHWAVKKRSRIMLLIKMNEFYAKRHYHNVMYNHNNNKIPPCKLTKIRHHASGIVVVVDSSEKNYSCEYFGILGDAGKSKL